MKLPEPDDALYRVKRGLAGYVSYLAACEMNASFSEYVLYEPILRILTARGFAVECEVKCPGIQQPPVGDKKKLDFVASKDGSSFAMEVKWTKTKQLNIQSDIDKLKAFSVASQGAAFLCVFGTESCISNLDVSKWPLKERGKEVVARFGKTRFGCRIYKLAESGGGDRIAPVTPPTPPGMRL